MNSYFCLNEGKLIFKTFATLDIMEGYVCDSFHEIQKITRKNFAYLIQTVFSKDNFAIDLNGRHLFQAVSRMLLGLIFTHTCSPSVDLAVFWSKCTCSEACICDLLNFVFHCFLLH